MIQSTASIWQTYDVPCFIVLFNQGHATFLPKFSETLGVFSSWKSVIKIVCDIQNLM